MTQDLFNTNAAIPDIFPTEKELELVPDTDNSNPGFGVDLPELEQPTEIAVSAIADATFSVLTEPEAIDGDIVGFDSIEDDTVGDPLLDGGATSQWVEAATREARSLLAQFATRDDVAQAFVTAFGTATDGEAVAQLRGGWLTGDDSSIPEIEVRYGAELGGAAGAYASATNTIYLSYDFLSQNAGNVDAVAEVLLEEIGHAIDDRVNDLDAVGDEGEIFSALVRGEVLSAAELSALRGEDDTAAIVLDGEWIAIEQADDKIQEDTLDFFANDIRLGDNLDFDGEFRFEDFFADVNEGGSFDNLVFGLDWTFNASAGIVPFFNLFELGDASFEYPIDIKVNLPSNVANGETFLIETTVDPIDNINPITGKGLQFLNAGIDLEYTLGPYSLTNFSITNPLGDPFRIDNISEPAFQDTVNIVEIGINDPNPKLKFPFLDEVIKVEAKLPEIEGFQTEKLPSNSGSSLLPAFKSSGDGSFLSLSGDIDKAISLIYPPAKALSQSLKFPNDTARNNVEIGYDIVDLTTNFELGLQQNLIFEPEQVEVTISVDGDPTQTQTISLGDPFELVAPSEGAGILEVTATYELAGALINEIDLIFQSFFRFDLIKAAVAANLGFLEVKKEAGPLLSVDFLKAQFDLLSLLGSNSDALITINPIDISEVGDNVRNVVELTYEIPYGLPVSISGTSVTEGDSGTTEAIFTVTLSEESSEPVTVNFTTEDGSAIAGSDYVTNSGTLTFAPGQTEQTISVSVIGDTERESGESFTVVLSNPSGASFPEEVTTLDATGTISDNDELPDQPNGGRGTTNNDPRLVTFDSLFYDYQAAGEFILVDSKDSTLGDLQIQTRQEPVSDNVSVNSAVATEIDGQRVVLFRTQDREPGLSPLQIDGVPVEVPDRNFIPVGNGRIYRTGGIYTIVYRHTDPDSGELPSDQLIASVKSNRVDLRILLAEGREGNVAGLFGNNNGDRTDDLALRDGTVLAQPIPFRQLYGEYADSWRISQQESLFDYNPGEDTTTFTNLNFPRRNVTLDDLDPIAIQRASAIADRFNLTDPILREAAIIDFILTGEEDESIFREAALTQTPEAELLVGISSEAGTNDTVPTAVNTPVAIAVLGNDDGTDGLPLAIASFDPTSAKGGAIAVDNNSTPNDLSDDRLVYTPPANFTGSDSFNYVLTDNTQTATATVNININALNLASLDGNNGFAINGMEIGGFTGSSVSNLGDVNGDGIDDLIVGALGADPNGNSAAGQTYVVFGNNAGFAANFELSTLNGSNGFAINGINPEDLSGGSVSGAGDVNGDGINDMIIGASGATINGNDDAGQAYVVFGRNTGFPASINLADLNGSNGFVVNGENAFDYVGLSVSGAGDVNGDSIDDVLVSAPGPLGSLSTRTYVIFGRTDGFAPSFSTSNIRGDRGFTILDSDGNSSLSVSGAGDVNGDGIDDLIIGADGSDTETNSAPTESYIVFGSEDGFADILDVKALDRDSGIALNGINVANFLGTSVNSAGDLDGDGFDDLLVGAFGVDEDGNSEPGKTYVLFGSREVATASGGGNTPFRQFLGSLLNGGRNAGIASNLSGLAGGNGFVLNGINEGDFSGISVAGNGDFNGDGFEDLVIGASEADANGNIDAGQSYVVFGGQRGFAGTVNLAALNGENGLIINGAETDDFTGTSVSSAGDVNGDGIDDLIIGTPGNFFDDVAGKSYVIFGSRGFGA